MKSFILLVGCLIVVIAAPQSMGLNSDNEIVISLKQCLKQYGMDPDIPNSIQHIDNNLQYPSNLLNEEDEGCFIACLYKAQNWLKEDGSIDLDLLLEENTAGESVDRNTIEKTMGKCRAKHGQNNCKFFQCFSNSIV